MLGKYLLESVPQGYEIHGLSRGGWPEQLSSLATMHKIQITDVKSVTKLLDEIKPDVVVHAAAEGRVDVVEGQIDVYKLLNIEVGEAIAKYCARNQSQNVFISSNAVFGGRVSTYNDESTPDPVNDYGRLKLSAELAVTSAHPESLILRPILMYGWPFPEGRGNPVVSWVKRLRVGEQIKVVDDVRTEPLAAWDCASAVWNGIRTQSSGVINVSGGASVTLVELARLTAKVFELNSELICAIPSSELTGLASRPMNTSFSLLRLKSDLGVFPTNPKTGLEMLRVNEDPAK